MEIIEFLKLQHRLISKRNNLLARLNLLDMGVDTRKK